MVWQEKELNGWDLPFALINFRDRLSSGLQMLYWNQKQLVVNYVHDAKIFFQEMCIAKDIGASP